MQHASHLDFRRHLDLEDQIRELSRGPEAQAGNIQFVGITGRADGRLFADVAAGIRQRVDEAAPSATGRAGCPRR